MEKRGRGPQKRQRRAYRVASERASERARLGGRTSVRIDRQNARWCGQKFRVTSKRRGYEHLLAEINKRRSGRPCRRDLLEHTRDVGYLLPLDGSLSKHSSRTNLHGELGSPFILYIYIYNIYNQRLLKS